MAFRDLGWLSRTDSLRRFLIEAKRPVSLTKYSYCNLEPFDPNVAAFVRIIAPDLTTAAPT
jgi:hypothetical protein